MAAIKPDSANGRVGLSLVLVLLASAVDVSTASAAHWLPNITQWQSTMPPVTSPYTMDTAELYVKSTVDDVTQFGWQNTECHKCALFETSISRRGNWSGRLGAAYPNTLQITASNGSVIYRSSSTALIDRGVYWLIVSTSAAATQLVRANNPDNPDLPVLYAFLFLLGAAVIMIFISLVLSKYVRPCLHGTRWSPEDNSPHVTSAPNGKASSDVTTAPVKPRLRSLDSFRGLSLTIMMFVNFGGGGYWYFDHALWNGLLVADLVFPWFIFIMGTSMAFSFRSLFNRDKSMLNIVWKICMRAVKLFALGIFLGTKYNNNMLTVRIPGVLQRFSLTYLVAALVHLPFAKNSHNRQVKGKLSDIVPYWLEWIVMWAILAVYLALTYALPLPGCPTGYVGPGGLNDLGQYFNCTGGAAGYIDRLVLTEDHIFQYPTISGVYKTDQGFDPEGILGTLSSIFLCYLGLQSGKIVQCYKGQHVNILVRWTVWGVITGAIGLLLCKASVNDGWVPLNKNLWSVSYILVMASTAYLLLVVMYIIIDVVNLWNGAPFIYPGMNSIVIFFCRSAFATNFPVSWQMPDMQSHWQKLLLAIWGTTFWTFIAFVLFRKKIFVAL